MRIYRDNMTGASNRNASYSLPAITQPSIKRGHIAMNVPLASRDTGSVSPVKDVPDRMLQMQFLEGCYRFRDTLKVREYLSNHPYLIPLLTKAYDKVREYFQSAALALEVATDPEGVDEPELSLFIITPLPAQESLDQLRKLNRDWWLKALPQGHKKLFIELELV